MTHPPGLAAALTAERERIRAAAQAHHFLLMRPAPGGGPAEVIPVIRLDELNRLLTEGAAGGS